MISSLAPNLSTLVHVLQHHSVLEQFFPTDTTDHWDMIHSIKSFLSIVLLLLFKSVSLTHQSHVRVSGSVAASESGRRFYYSSSSTNSSSQEMKWVELKGGEGPQGGASTVELLTELLKLVKSILNLSLSSSCVVEIDKYCQSQLVTDHSPDHTHTGYAVQDKPLINLILNDTNQLTELCLALSSAHQLVDISKGTNPSISSLNGFVKFLRTNCRRMSCFRQPLLTMIESCCHGNRRSSSFVLNVLEQFSLVETDDTQKESEGISSFITEGL